MGRTPPERAFLLSEPRVNAVRASPEVLASKSLARRSGPSASGRPWEHRANVDRPDQLPVSNAGSALLSTLGKLRSRATAGNSGPAGRVPLRCAECRSTSSCYASRFDHGTAEVRRLRPRCPCVRSLEHRATAVTTPANTTSPIDHLSEAPWQTVALPASNLQENRAIECSYGTRSAYDPRSGQNFWNRPDRVFRDSLKR